MAELSIPAYLSQHEEKLNTAIAAAVRGVILKRAEQPLRDVAEALLQANGDDELTRLREENTRLLAEVQRLHSAGATDSAGRRFARQAAGELKGVSAMNDALYRMGALAHQPPRFRYFDPKLEEQCPITIKEVRLPFSAQTHEVCYEPLSQCLFVTQMTNSVLVRIPVGADGLLLDDQDAWMIGPTNAKGDGISGLHNASLSPANPGCLWLSLQLANQLVLVEAATMRIRKVLLCPSLLTRADGTAAKVGGPHCLRECGATGRIHVALKGSVPCHPGEDVITDESAKDLKVAVRRVCCNPAALRERMAQLEQLGYGEAGEHGELDEAFAVWSLHPDEYESRGAARGGELFECEPSPPMIAIGGGGDDLWVAQDRTPRLLHVHLPTHAATQVAVPHPLDADCQMRITGPAIVTDPAGGVWCSLLGGNGALVRIDPTTHARTLYILPRPAWMRTMRFIHVAFVKSRTGFSALIPPAIFGRTFVAHYHNCTIGFAICSNLVDDASINALIVFLVTDDCRQIISIRLVPLPTQDCCCHRIGLLTDGLAEENWSVVVSELASSKVMQIKMGSMMPTINYFQRRSISADGFEVRRYELWESGSYELTKSAQSFGEGFRGDVRTYMVGEKQERSDLPASFVVPGYGVWSAKFDTVAGTMHADMETDFIGEQHMYDWPGYPEEAPNLKEPVREEREAGAVSAP